MAGIRMLVVWCPDWPLVSWGVPLDEPAAVLVANRVVATTPAARAAGVARGHRRREAQGRCPELAVLDRDADREARLFEPVAGALEAITPRIEVAGPGLVGFPTRGPSRFFGGDLALAEHTRELVRPVLPKRAPVRVAVADGVFAARLAARTTQSAQSTQSAPAQSAPAQSAQTQSAQSASAQSASAQSAQTAPSTQTALAPTVGEPASNGVRVLEPGASPGFLASLPITALEMPELTDVLVRLGLTTLGSLAALSLVDVVGRFGRDGGLAHRLASGEDEHPPDLRRPAPDLAVSWAFDPPAERLEQCAFAAKALADELHEGLASRGLSCTRVAIEAETESGERQLRLWRHQGALSAAALADRSRWQLEAWLNGSGPARPSTGVARLSLIPDEVVAAHGRQLGLWGARQDRAEPVARVVGRLQAMLGPDAVSVAEFRGGLGPGERIRLVPAAVVDLEDERPAAGRHFVAEPWPGQIPPPSPARVHPDPVPVEVADEEGRPVGVDGRGEITAAPARVCPVQRTAAWRGARRVVGWAGPWPAEQRWWDPLTRRRRARMQVVLDDQTAHLLILEQGAWALEASYD